MNDRAVLAAMSPVPAGPMRADRPGDGLRAFGLAQLQAAARLLAHRGQARHEGVHEARKCLRRVRALLALAGPRLGTQAITLDAELRRLCRGLSPLRDASALLEALQRLERGGVITANEAALAVAAASARREDRLSAALARDPELVARRRRLQRAAEKLAALDWPAVRCGDLRRGLARSERRLRRAAGRASRHRKNDAAWHRLRRRLRRWRQQNSLLGDIVPALVQHSAAREALAVRLGESQDDALLLARCGGDSPFTPALRRPLRKVARMRLQALRAEPVSVDA
ncbi:CHAD domain-containing protein [Tahibacter sp. UC22_41]|uniref:CHAD domain-containing protein n=1 Tax=Tahibacter sp. UC22_41 TaxID=3350178 RepID=UPI0036DE8D7C